MQNDRLTTINNTTQMDLQGQVASESSGHRRISGTGGQLQFMRAGYASDGGKSFICMSSTYERNSVRRSRIVLDLTPGNDVTTPRSGHDVRGHRVRPRQPEGQVDPGTGESDDLARPPEFRDDLDRDARATA